MKCIDCNEEMTITGSNQKRCVTCRKIKTKEHIRNWMIRKGILTGEGSGSKSGKSASNYKTGLDAFKRKAKEKLTYNNYCCERCGNKIDASKRGTWAGHHKDHDRTNNVETNMEVLCKRCHQVEHKCWTAFEGVTTILKESTHENVEVPSVPRG